jgi:hypothetical protein
MANRRAALDGLARILDAGAPEDLFTGSDEEAIFLYELLTDAARARGASCYWEICRTARRRGVTPDYVADRAAVLLAAIVERRRTDLYRILGVPPLASGETIRERWLQVVKRLHPDVGGEAAHFRQAKQAYEVLRDPVRRAEYERFWLRALGPFERVAPHDGELALEARSPVAEHERAADATERDAGAPGAGGDGTDGTAPAAPTLAAAARVAAARADIDERIAARGGRGVSILLDRVAAALAPVDAAQLRTLAAEIDALVVELESLRDRLRAVGELKARLRV